MKIGDIVRVVNSGDYLTTMFDEQRMRINPSMKGIIVTVSEKHMDGIRDMFVKFEGLTLLE